jgi:hypothetical protein
MDTDTKEIIALSEKISRLCEDYKNFVALNATINVCAMAIVNASDTREKADKAADQLARMLSQAVGRYWSAGHSN